VLVDVHGALMSGDEEDALTRMRTLAPALAFIVIQPSAPDYLGAPSWQTDEGFPYDDTIWGLVQATLDVLDGDRDRVHFMGFSQGGNMTFRMLCSHADEIASVAPTAELNCFDADGAGPPIARPILYTHGHSDQIVPFALYAEPARSRIKAHYGLDGDGDPFMNGSQYEAHGWTNADGVDFEFWEHDYDAPLDVLFGGHCLAGPASDERFRCEDSEFDASEQILRFFVDHPRP
jgi:predicted esterase